MSDKLTEQVRRSYGAAAQAGLGGNADNFERIAAAFGYSPEELAAIPAESNLGLSCGNPVALAGPKPGETIVDLGSGGGIDVFLVAEKVGPAGQAIGIDMTEEMIELARRNAAGRGGNIRFHLGTIDNIPLADNTVDCVISNCVINLASDKRAVWREVFRILKPGGRVAVSDIALKRALPREMRDNLAAYVGCIAGAVPIEAYKEDLRQAGFSDIAVLDSGSDLNAYKQADGQAGCCGPAMAEAEQAASCCGPASGGVKAASPAGASVHDGLSELIDAHDLNQWASSVQVLAVKPA